MKMKLAVLAGIPLLAAAACRPLECAKGTRQEGDQCVPVYPPAGDAGIRCGPGTVLVGNECVASQDVCGPNTKVVPQYDDAGVVVGFICEGKGGGTMPTCPEDFGPNGEYCVTGQVKYFVGPNGEFMDKPLADPNAAEDATWLKIEVYDPIAYAEDPDAATPMAITEVDPKTGYFKLTGLSVPANEAIALVVDELDPTAEDVVATTATPYEVSAFQNLEGVSAFAITNTQISDWTGALGGDSVLEALGCPAPEGGGSRDLLNCGTWVAVYSKGSQDEPGLPVEGVEPKIATAAGSRPLEAEATFYMGLTSSGQVAFDDPAAGVVWSDGDGPHEWTGRLGVVFYPGAQVRQYTGDCGPGLSRCGCYWKAVQGGSARGAILVQYMFPNSCND